MTTSTTRTHTNTYTEEEKAVLAAVGVRHSHRRGRWTMEAIQGMIHSNSTTSDLVDVPDWLSPVVLGQLIERGLVYRCATEPEAYTVQS